MKAARARSTFTVEFGQPDPVPRPTPRGRIPRVARMLALGHKIEGMVQAGQLRDYADAARVLGLTRARITQITNLLLLAPAIQEEILSLSPVACGRDPISERQLREIVSDANWEHQEAMWTRLGLSDRGR